MNEATEVAKWHIDDRFIKNDEQAILWGLKFGELETDGFINTTTDAIATDGRLEDFFRNYNPKTLTITQIGSMNQRKQSGTNRFAFLVSISDTSSRMKAIFL